MGLTNAWNAISEHEIHVNSDITLLLETNLSKDLAMLPYYSGK